MQGARVEGEGESERQGKSWLCGGKRKGKEEEEIQTGKCGPAGDLQISKIYWPTFQEVTFCKVGMGDHPATMRQSTISGTGPPYIARGGRGIHCQCI